MTRQSRRWIQQKYRDRQKEKAAAAAGKAASLFQEDNLLGLESGLQVRDAATRLPAEYQVHLAADLALPEFITHLDAMHQRAADLLELVTSHAIIDMIEFSGMYGQLTNKIDMTRNEIEGGNLRPANYGTLTPQRAARSEANYARDISNLLSQFKYAFAHIEEKGLTTDSGKPYKAVIKGMAGNLASVCGKFRSWAALRQWQERGADPRKRVDDIYGDALA